MLAMATTSAIPSSEPLRSNVGSGNAAVTTTTTQDILSQPIASTSAVTLDTPILSNAAATTFNTSDNPVKVTPVQQSQTIKEEDEDAKLLASLARGLSNGQHGFNEAESQSLLAALTNVNPPPTLKPEAFDDSMFPSNTFGATPGDLEDPSGPIQAYAKLEFPGFSYYLQTLSCTIGRRPAHMRTPALQQGEEQHITGAQKLEGDVDVDLGLLKSISRLHVRIYYQDQPRQNSQSFPNVSDMFGQRSSPFDANGDQGRFVLQVLGRNGAFVDDVLVLRDAIVPLGKRTKIQIAERVFYFVLPPVPLAQTYNSDGEVDSGESLVESEGDESESLGSSESDEESSGLSSMDEDESEEEKGQKGEEEVKKRPKLVLKKKPVPPSRGGKGKGNHQGKTIWAGKGKTPAKGKKEEMKETGEEEEGEEEEMAEDGIDDEVEGEEEGKTRGKGSSKKGKQTKQSKEVKGKGTTSDNAGTGRKRKRGDTTDQEHEVALKVGTPIGVEALNLKPKKKKKAAGGDVGSVDQTAASTSSGTSAKEKGKGGGKAHIVAAAMAAKAKADEQSSTKAASASSVPASVAVPTSTVSVRPIIATAPIRPNNAGLVPAGGQNASSTNMTSATPRPSASGVAVRPLLPASSTGNNPTVPVVRPGTTPSVPLSYSTPIRPNAGPSQSQRPVVPATLPAATLSGPAQAPIRPNMNGVTPDSTSSPATFPPSAAAFAHLTNPKAKTQPIANQPLPPAGAGIKPELSNMELIKNALANATSVSRGGKLTLQEIYEDITGKYEWYRNNNRANGRDWHSSIRHAVGSNRDMVRIPRKANEQGKGIFYALNSSEAARIYRVESSNSVNGATPALGVNNTSTTAGIPTTPASATTAQASTSTTSTLGVNVPTAVPLTPSISPTPPMVATPVRPPVPAAQSARPSTPIQSNGRVTIVIGKAPAQALAQMAAVPKAAITQSIESLFGGPPIVHHEGKLYLSPVVFGHMSASEISDIGGKGAAQALALLQSQLVKHLQSKMNAGRGAPARPARPPVAAGGATPPNTAMQGSARPANAGPNSLSSRPKAPNGAPSNSMARPPSVSGTQPIRPLQNRPVSAPTTGSPVQRPPQGTTLLTGTQSSRPPTPVATPPGSNMQAHPLGSGIVDSLQQGVRPVGTAGIQSRPPQNQSGSVAPLINRPPMTSPAPPLPVARPQQQQFQRPPQSATLQRAQSSPAPVRPVTMVSPAPSPQSAVRPPSAVVGVANTIQSGAQQPGPRYPPPTSNVTPRPTPPQPQPTPSTPSATTKSGPTASVTAPASIPPPPSSNAMLSAMQALASHPDAAGLMPLLSGGKMESGTKLTPSQLELLQRVGRIAEEQQRAQQQRRDQAQVTTNNSSPSPAPKAMEPLSQNNTSTTSSPKPPPTTLEK